MAGRSLKRVKRLLVVFTLVVGALGLLHVLVSAWAVHALKERIHDAAAKAGAEWSTPDRTAITLDLLAGDVSITDLRWSPLADADPSVLTASGHLDSVIVRGLSYSSILFRERVAADRFALFGSDAHITLPRDSSQERSKGSELIGIRLGNVQLHLQNSRVTLADSTNVSLTDLVVNGAALKVDLQDPDVSAASFTANALGLRADPFADSVLVIGGIAFDGVTGELLINEIAFGPSDVVERAKTVVVERDVIAGSLQRLEFHGMDVDALLKGVVSFRSVHVGPARLAVARDKVLRDPPFEHKPLPAHLLRALPVGTGTDSVTMERLKVDYYERVDVGRGFAHIPFDSISCSLVNVHHVAEDTLFVKATGFLFDHTPLALDLRAHIGDSTDLIVVDANVGRLAFPQLNKVLTKLTGVAIPEGRLDTMILRMNGRDRQANARCWMRYDGLKLDRRMDKNRALDPVFNGLLNAVVKRGRTGEKDGQGWESYAWDRRRDRALFNYLWAGVREGAKTSMLPKAVVDQVSKK